MAFSAKRTGFSVVTRSLTEAEALSHQIDLGFTPRFPQALLMFVADGGGHRVPGVDFDVEGSVIRWAGKELEVLEPGDQVSIVTG
jgi:hypothetical protein